MAATLHHRVTEQPNLKKVIVWSLMLHVAVLVGMSLSLTHRVRVSTPTVQVKLVGVPQPKAASSKVEPQKVRTQDSAAPKDPPKEMKNIPPSDAKTKFVTDTKETTPDKKETPIEAKERPPVLDKSPKEKKVVKNEKDAKVVKNPEDFLENLDDFLEKADKPSPKPKDVTPDPTKQAGEGPQLQLNLSDQGVNDAIGMAVNKNWVIPPGKDLNGLTIVVQIKLGPSGDLIGLRVVQSSGDASFDATLIRAIRKSIPLPIPSDKMGAYADFEMAFSQ
ncbi:MAG: TonB family protein [Blastochloris viridis]|uniref:TonB family protein n=1 Tax=Blastochloris viridis TaxID=1079 RepID=A0A6N4RD60_BLAVI|nr:MAG: TonB family protein [Blastochloris viridis]